MKLLTIIFTIIALNLLQLPAQADDLNQLTDRQRNTVIGIASNVAILRACNEKVLAYEMLGILQMMLDTYKVDKATQRTTGQAIQEITRDLKQQKTLPCTQAMVNAAKTIGLTRGTYAETTEY